MCIWGAYSSVVCTGSTYKAAKECSYRANVVLYNCACIIYVWLLCSWSLCNKGMRYGHVRMLYAGECGGIPSSRPLPYIPPIPPLTPPLLCLIRQCQILPSSMILMIAIDNVHTPFLCLSIIYYLLWEMWLRCCSILLTHSSNVVHRQP